uniref:C2H2-type domain-containing protein n=1 Tax=Denticeps clupeoides TaxID=299321 RepID=A0AAY4F0N2_9TELE
VKTITMPASSGLPLSTLRFLTSPLRLLSSAVWKIVQQRDVLNYGMLEEFVTSVTESVPELLSYRQRAQLVLGLRAKVRRIPSTQTSRIIFLIRDVDVETSESNFLALVEILLNDPVERNIFFQEVFPVEYGAKFDSALQKLIWTFVTRLEEVLPEHNVLQTASMLTSAPAVMEECLEVLSHPQDLQDLLYHHKHLENVNFSCRYLNLLLYFVLIWILTVVDGQEQNLHNHLMQNHPEEHQRLLVAGVHGAEGPESPRPKACHRGPFRRFVVSKMCPVCSKTFSRGTDMRRHLNSHSGLRPYRCGGCGKRFQHLFDAKRHEQGCGVIQAPTNLNGERPEPQEHQPLKEDADDQEDFQDGKTYPDPPSVCPTCGKTFTRATDMRRHQKCHLSRRFACPKCSESFRYPFDLKQHQRDVCGESGGERSVEARSLKMHFTCDRCGKKFNQFTKLERHKLLHDQPRKPPKRLHKCAKCAEMFRTLYELGKHQRCHWGDDPLRCTQCGRRFSSTSHLTGHKQVHLLVCTLKCTMCEETCTELPSLRQHYAAAHQVKRAYPCSHCEKSFTELCSLVRHLRVHTGERPYRCSQCPKSFISPSKLLLHEKAHAGTAKRERQHLCHECGKCFYTSAELTRHEVCHREDRPHTCAHCGKSFKRLRSLTSHMESHSDERVGHPCSYCGKLFSKPGALVRHNRIHTGERPHACGECHKRFLTHSEVQKHMRYHTGERPFKCAHCRKSFTQSCYLTAHMRTHTGERPYACGFCERRFADNAHMKRHLLIHTGEKPYVCEQCGKAFNRKNLLNLHLKAHLSK